MRDGGAGGAKKNSSTAIFWVLLLAGLSVMGACIIGPVWLECKRMAAQRAQLAEKLEELQTARNDEKEAIRAAQADVAFNERLLMEELNYQRPGEDVLAPVLSRQTARDRPQADQPEGPLAWIRALEQQDVRIILLAMSMGLIIFALLYYRPGRKSEGARQLPEIPVRTISAQFTEPAEKW